MEYDLLLDALAISLGMVTAIIVYYGLKLAGALARWLKS